MMRRTWLIFRRELAAFASSPFAAVVGALFSLIVGYSFSLALITTCRVDIYPLVFKYMANVLLVIVPLLTMYLLAGERQSGSVALLLTSPVGEWPVVLGKFLAALAVVAVYVASTLPYAAVLFSLGSPDPGPILLGYVGILLLAGLFCSAGLFASSLTAVPLVAAVVGFGLITFLGVADRLQEFAGPGSAAFFDGLSYVTPCQNFFGGVLYGRHVVYFVTATFFFLFATQRMLASNRWR